MTQLVIKSSSHNYHVIIGRNIRKNLKKYLVKDYSSFMIVTDTNVAKLYLEDVRSGLPEGTIFQTVILHGEQSKDIDTYYQLQTEAIENGLDRNALVIALGGGVVGDLAGFFAATFLRGIDYIQVPTTILAHDSSVGGKVAINHSLGKNLIGSFYPPRAVVYDVETLMSLDPHEIRSGYAELLKEALISNAAFLEQILTVELSDLSNETLSDHLYRGIEVKAKIVEADEKEAGERMFLNLGHTLGHALEAELGYGVLTHGEAVAIGILFALQISEDRFAVQLPYEEVYQWLITNNYPLTLPNINPKNIIEKMKLDKKVVHKTIQMVLLKKIGEPAVEEINEQDLYLALKLFMERLGGR